VTLTADPLDLKNAFDSMHTFWMTAELDARYMLSILETNSRPMPAKLKHRAHTTISRELARAAERRTELTKWLATGFGPAGTIREILPRLENTDTVWRRILATVRAIPLAAELPPPAKAIDHPHDIPFWLQQLDAWAQPETEIILDLKDSIDHGDARSDEALDHVQWSAEDDIEAIDAVVRRCADWPVYEGTKVHLQQKSEEARSQLQSLITLVEKARPFSQSQQIGAALARLAQEQGHKPH